MPARTKDKVSAVEFLMPGDLQTKTQYALQIPRPGIAPHALLDHIVRVQLSLLS